MKRVAFQSILVPKLLLALVSSWMLATMPPAHLRAQVKEASGTATQSPLSETDWKKQLDRVGSKFAQACSAADTDAAYDLMIPELKELVDQPILAKFVSKVRANLGEFRSLAPVEKIQVSEDQQSCEADLKAQFEKGEATLKINLRLDRLQGFEVVSDKMEDWFDGLDSTEFYQRQGSTFIRHFMNGKADKVYAMCHPALQEVVAGDALVKMIDRVRVDMGALKSVKFANATQEMTEETQKVVLEFQVECEKATTNCELIFQLIGMKGHLIGFNFE